MEHIRQYDWHSSQRETYFVNERDIDNCVIEKILRNKFTDPSVSSDEEEEIKKPKINWDEVFNKNQYANYNNYNKKQMNVPGLRMVLLYPKLSSLSVQQHYQCLKVLCASNPDILDMDFIPRPTKNDLRVFQEVQETYLEEQLEYKEWAKQQWITSHCLRSIRPKPCIEMVYDADFKVRVHAMQAFPKTYEMAAQIPLETNNAECDIVLNKSIINVDIVKLPEIQIPSMTCKKCIVMSQTSIPEICIKHPCKFVLPSESSMTILPLPEVHREMAQFAADNEVSCIISEEALRCIIEQSRYWQLAVSVCEIIQNDGDRMNVLVIGDEFSIKKQSAQTRTYQAYSQLLYDALIPPSERRKLYSLHQEIDKPEEQEQNKTNDLDTHDSSDDEDENSLFIDTGESNLPENEDTPMLEIDSNTEKSQEDDEPNQLNKENIDTVENQLVLDENNISDNKNNDSVTDESQIGIYTCSCKDTIFENPPPRSYKKWKVTNKKNKETYDLIIHCSHKTKIESSEAVLEPIVEYQIDMGGSEQSKEKLTSLATSLMLRDNARLINFRIDASTGELVTLDHKSLEELKEKHQVDLQQPANYLYTIINQLQGLLPGKYLLHHDASLASNAFLYASKCTGDTNTITIPSSDVTHTISEHDEVGNLTAPVISSVLLPYHKFRKILPCAFTPFQSQVARDMNKRITRQKTPPRAALWPKKKKRGNKNRCQD